MFLSPSKQFGVRGSFASPLVPKMFWMFEMFFGCCASDSLKLAKAFRSTFCWKTWLVFQWDHAFLQSPQIFYSQLCRINLDGKQRFYTVYVEILLTLLLFACPNKTCWLKTIDFLSIVREILQYWALVRLIKIPKDTFQTLISIITTYSGARNVECQICWKNARWTV